MDVARWLEALDRLTAPDGWVSADDIASSRAREVLEGYRQQTAWIGHRFVAERTADDQAVMPDAVTAAKVARDALLCLAVVAEMLARVDQLGDAGSRVESLPARLVDAAMTSPTGLRPKVPPIDARQGEGPYQQVDFAHSDGAREFFEGRIRRKLLKLDKRYGTTLAAYAGERYETDSQASIERWSRAWTASVALVILDWIQAKGCETAQDVVRELWCNYGPDGQMLPGWRVHFASPLPSGHRSLHIELRSPADLAQVFEGRDNRWALPNDEVVSMWVSMKHLTIVHEGGEVYYPGHAIRHLYLMVLADGLRVANRGG